MCSSIHAFESPHYASENDVVVLDCQRWMLASPSELSQVDGAKPVFSRPIQTKGSGSSTSCFRATTRSRMIFHLRRQATRLV